MNTNHFHLSLKFWIGSFEKYMPFSFQVTQNQQDNPALKQERKCIPSLHLRISVIISFAILHLKWMYTQNLINNIEKHHLHQCFIRTWENTQPTSIFGQLNQKIINLIIMSTEFSNHAPSWHVPIKNIFISSARTYLGIVFAIKIQQIIVY